MARMVKKFLLDADDEVHSFTYGGGVLMVDSTRYDPNIIEVLVETGKSGETDKTHKLRAFATGQNVPDDAVYCGSTNRNADGTIWHVYEVVA
jgi:hypothetical protein